MTDNILPVRKGFYFEDLEVGQRYASPRITVTEDAIIRFALEWDPHVFHIDREQAKNSIFRQLVGSGLHTIVLTSRMVYDSGLFHGTSIAGLSVGNMQFLKPLLPGDTIGAVVEIINKSETAKHERGKISLGVETVNHRGEMILYHERQMLISRRVI